MQLLDGVSITLIYEGGLGWRFGTWSRRDARSCVRPPVADQEQHFATMHEALEHFRPLWLIVNS